MAREQKPAAILIDVHLAKRHGGLDVLAAVKADRDVPTLVMSADADQALRLEAIQRGADDYLYKPFDTDDLEQRLKFLLRADEPPPDPDQAIGVGDLAVDTAREAIFRKGEMIRLSLTDWRLFELLLAHNGEAVLYRELLTRALGRSQAAQIELLQACIGRLREKLDSGVTGSKIVDFHGVGYALAYSPVRPHTNSGK
jgi:two-component system KDP operon response regulator KdpE